MIHLYAGNGCFIVKIIKQLIIVDFGLCPTICMAIFLPPHIKK